MNKNGAYFVALVTEERYSPAHWDPFTYRSHEVGGTLSDYACIERTAAKRIPYGLPRFRPIEYHDLPGGECLSFTLERRTTVDKQSAVAVEAGALLFGTMRAYLGNVAVTPQAAWIGCEAPVFFETKSEFVSIKPDDGLTYFWMAYLRSRHFLQHLPLGSGGTRPRLNPLALGVISVSVPDLPTRKSIHDRLYDLARREWATRSETADAIQYLFQSL